MLYITLLSIASITLIVWLVKKLLKFEICPICAGVMLTWLWMLVGMKLNLLSSGTYLLLTGILMGGTIVGLMSKLEKHIKPRFILWWKTIFVLSGFTAVYSILNDNWMLFVIAVVIPVICTLVCTIKKGHQISAQEKELEDKMKNCC